MQRGEGAIALRWSESKQAGVLLLVAFILAAGLPGLQLIEAISEGDGLVEGLGQAAGLVGLSLLALQSVLSSRIRLIEQPFGLDRLMRFHKAMAVCACLLLLAHPLLLAAGEGAWGIFSLQAGAAVNMGKLALLSVVMVVAGALLYRKVGLSYQTWRAMHKAAPVAAAIGLTHAMMVADDIRPPAPLGIYLTALLVLAIGLSAYRNVFVPLWGVRRYTVGAVAQASHNTWTLALGPEGLPMADHKPGQFAFLKLRRAGLRTEEHPFTISSAPAARPGIAFTIKESGDYTRTIGRTQPGDGALVEGPFGRFSLAYSSAPRFLFIAGGVGITPLISMLRHMRDTGDARPVTLLWGNRQERDILFREELDAMPANVSVLHVLSEPGEDWAGPAGYVTADLIRDRCSDCLADADVFLCGPPPMMDSVTEALVACGVPRRRIRTERFAL